MIRVQFQSFFTFIYSVGAGMCAHTLKCLLITVCTLRSGQRITGGNWFSLFPSWALEVKPGRQAWLQVSLPVGHVTCPVLALHLDSWPTTLKWPFSLIMWFLASLSNVNWQYIWLFFLGLSIVIHWSVCLFLCPVQTVLITVALWCGLKSQRKWMMVNLDCHSDRTWSHLGDKALGALVRIYLY